MQAFASFSVYSRSRLKSRLRRNMLIPGLALCFSALIPYAPAASAATVHVDGAASGSGTGTSWADAFTNLQDALDAANSGDQIWVAEGVYYPDVGVGRVDGDESESFVIPAGIAVYGGFDPGSGATVFANRDWYQHVTILSGDVDGNDVNTDLNNIAESSNDVMGGNSDRVVFLDGTSTAVTGATVLDGVVITAGQASGGFFDNFGAGLKCVGPRTCGPTLSNITFIGNLAFASGGGMWVDGSPSLTNVIFSGNRARQGGAGGLYVNGGSPTLTNAVFSGNLALQGGAILARPVANTQMTLTNVTFSGNHASLDGGALFLNADAPGGSIGLPMTNVIMWNNSARPARGPNIWKNTNLIDIDINHSVVEGGLGSIDGFSLGDVQYDALTNSVNDPLFVLPVDPLDAPTSDGDLRLQTNSPAINAGDNSAVPVGVTTDLAGNDRVVNGTVDIGAYEYLPPNQRPVANAGGPYTAECNTPELLNGSGSDDPDGDPLTYSWSASLGSFIDETLVTPTLDVSGVPHGSTINVMLEVEDDKSESNTDATTVTVEDTIAPTVSCPADIEQQPTDPAGNFVTYTPTAADGCDASPAVSSAPPSGSQFGVGTNTLVTTTATDAAGNSAQCTFTVTILSDDEMLSDLRSAVLSLHSSGKLNTGAKNSLLAHVTNSERALSKTPPKTLDACTQLNVFITKVNNEIRSGRLPRIDGLPLIATATNLRMTLSC